MEDQSWLEPEKVDEGLEATTTATASSSCLDWSVDLVLHLIAILC